MKIAVLTWFNRGDNAGQVLQAYALQEAIKKVFGNNSVLLLDYQYKYRKYLLNPLLLHMYRIYKALRSGSLKKYRSFKNFRASYLNTSRAFFSEKDMCCFLRRKKIRNIVLGSDQLWNPKLGRVPEALLLNINVDGIVKASYSPSFCCSNEYLVYKDELNKIGKSIEDFAFIGVRDFQLKKQLQLLTNKEIHLMLDPVFLISADEYRQLTSKEITNNLDNSIFIYIVGDVIENELIDFVDCLRITNNIDRVVLIEMKRVNNIPSTWKIVCDYNPATFLRMIDEAAIVIGDSFHMCAYSIIFRKQFYAFMPKSNQHMTNPERIWDLLKIFSLEERIIRADDEHLVNKISEINYCGIEKTIEENVNKNKKLFQLMCSVFK